MQHRAIRAMWRDPTVLLVSGIVLVILVVVAITQLSGGSGSGPSSTPPPSTPAATSSAPPTTSPTETPSSPKPLRFSKRSVCVPETPDADLTVVDYNIKSGHGGGSLAQIAAALQASDADIVLLQEVDVHRATAGGVDMPAYFGSALGMYHAFGENVSYGPGRGYGTAILSRFPIVSVDNTHLPRPGNTQQRGLLHVVVNVNGQELSVYDTHLQNRDEPARIAQMHAILGIVDADPRPQIFGGDFNAQPESPPSVLARTHFTDTWATVGVGTGRTHPANHLRGRIDYLYSAGDRITPMASDVLPARLSDHMAVRGSYRLAGPPTKVCVQMLTDAPSSGQGSKKSHTSGTKGRSG